MLRRLEERERRLRRGAALFSENDRVSDLFVLREGTMMSYVLLDDGSRQILRFLFPGDIIATATLVYATAPETVMAITDCTVSPFDRQVLAELVSSCPRLAMALMASEQRVRVAMTDRLAAVGRTSARARVAALLLELRDRMRELDPSIGTVFALGITQEEIGDAIGLTAVHVNRMLRQLEEQGLIARAAGRLTLVDEAKLMRAANYVDRNAKFDLEWLQVAE